MSHKKPRPREYSLSINVSVSISTVNQSQHKHSFDIHFSSNIATWCIHRSLSDLQHLDTQCRCHESLRSVKLPQGLVHFSSYHSNRSPEIIVEQYLWRLLRRAYVFQSPPIQKFIKLPPSLMTAIASLSEQSCSVIHDDYFQYLMARDQRTSTNIDENGKEKRSRWTSLRCILYTGYIMEGYNINHDDDAKKEEDLYDLNPFFRIDVVEIERVVRFSKENKFTVHLHRGESFSIRCSDHSIFRKWTEEIKNMINLREGYTPYLTRWEPESHELSESASDRNLMDKLYPPSVDDSGDSKLRDDKVDVDIISCFHLSDHSGDDETSEDTMDHLLKRPLSEESQLSDDNVGLIDIQSSSKRDDIVSNLSIAEEGSLKEEVLVIEDNSHNTANATKGKRENKEVVSMKDYKVLQEQLAKWQSTAYRWQNMVNLQDAQRATMQRREMKYKKKVHDQQKRILSLTKRLRQKEYELGQSHKALIKREKELAHTLKEFDDSTHTIDDLIRYKESNEYRKQNSYCDGTLWKFTGDGMSYMKWNKAPKLKYVMYVPTKRRLYHSDSVQDNADTKLVNVTYVSRQNTDIERLLPAKYKGRWIKVIGENRIVLFVAKDKQDADRWYHTIQNSLLNFKAND